MAKILFTKYSEKKFLKLKLSDQKKILKSIEKIRKNPLVGEKLKGELEGQLKVRAWPFRVIYLFTYEEDTITILEIGHRQGVYK